MDAATNQKLTIKNTLSAFTELELDYLSANRGQKPLVGYLCLRVPPEYIEACNGIPLRLIPRDGFDNQDHPRVRSDGCSFCRTLPALIKLDYYKGMSAIIAGACCDQMRRSTEVLASSSDLPVWLYGAPRTWNTPSEYFKEEMIRTFANVQSLTLHTPSENDLSQQIGLRNQLKTRIRALRDQGLLSTPLLHQINASPLPPEQILKFFKEYTDEEVKPPLVRLMLAGSIPGVWEIVEFEAHGAKIMADATCLGDRVVDRLIDDTGDPIQALYDGYIEDNNCPHRRPVTPLIDYMRELADRRQIDGIIYRSVKYCHPWGLAAERMKRELGMPMLILDDDLTSPAVSNLRTRAGAFIEMLRSRKGAHQ